MLSLALSLAHLMSAGSTVSATGICGLWQVALLFIVTAGDGVAHEPAWRSWFAAAEGLVPASVVSHSGARQHVPSLSRCARLLVRRTCIKQGA